MDVNTLLKSLRDRARQLPYSRAQLAKKAGLSARTLDDWDRIAEWSPTAKTLRALERFVDREERKHDAR